MIWTILGLLALGVAVCAISCAITVALFNRTNLRETLRKAIRSSQEEKAKELIGKALTATIKEITKNGTLTVYTIDMLDDDNNQVAKVTVSSEEKSDDLFSGDQFRRIVI